MKTGKKWTEEEKKQLRSVVKKYRKRLALEREVIVLQEELRSRSHILLVFE